MKAIVSAAFCGVLFALGLGLSGMTQPAKVLAFLDVAGDWDPSLAFVMAGAMGTHALLRPRILRLGHPLLGDAFPSSGKQRVDGRLLGGAALFGVGWGLSGYCPGPALTSVVTGARSLLLFVVGMAVGMLLFQVWDRAAHRRTLHASEPRDIRESSE